MPDSHPELNSTRRKSLGWIFVGILVVAIFLYAFLKSTQKDVRVPTSNSGGNSQIPTILGNISFLPKQGGPPGYISSPTCQECHPKQFESWWRSHHRQMTQIMTTNTVQADFNGVSLEFGGERFTLHEAANHYWVDIQIVEELEAIRKTNGVSRPPIRVPMEMVTGSHHFQVFWLPGAAGNLQIGFPFTWLVEDRRWVERHNAFIRDPTAEQFPEQWNQTCIRCHATGARPMPDKEKQEFNTHVTELGIACEACHGPAERHVAKQRKLKRDGTTSSEPDSTIVQPADLDHVRSSQICGFCHSMKWFTESEGWRQNGFRYRPGDDLEKTTPIIRVSKLAEQPWLTNVLAKNPDIMNDFFWPDGMIRVAGREFNGLIESACYQKGKLACVTCHSMHKSDPDKQVKEGMHSNRACYQCHQDYEAKLREHTHHQANSPGSLCYNCHLPYNSYGLLRGIRSHQIERPAVQVALNTGRPNACNQCHLDKTLEWTAHKLSDWYGQPIPAFAEEDRTISATVKHLLAGDAGQRALAAFSMGWEPAWLASGTNWQAPLLAQALEDPYAAVRFIAHRSLRQLPGFETFRYNFEAPPNQWRESKENALALWRSTALPLPENDQTLTGRGPVFNTGTASKLQTKRDNRPMHLRE